MGTLASLFQRKEFQSTEEPFITVDPATRYAYLAKPSGLERIDSAYRRVLMPLFDWPMLGANEEDAIIQVLAEAAGANPLKVTSPDKVDDIFWVKNRGWKALFFNPSLAGKFLIPDDLEIFTSSLVPENQIVLVGGPEAAGYYVVQGDRTGMITNKKTGLLQLQFLVV